MAIQGLNISLNAQFGDLWTQTIQNGPGKPVDLPAGIFRGILTRAMFGGVACSECWLEMFSASFHVALRSADPDALHLELEREVSFQLLAGVANIKPDVLL